METQSASHTAVDTLVVQYDLHTKLFFNVLKDISAKDAQNRLNTKANHMAWIAGSLVHERYGLANIFGQQLKQTSYNLFKDHKGIQDDLIYPSLEEYKKDWEQISPILRNPLLHVTDEQLEGPDPFDMPGEDITLFDAVTFLVDRESYCIGQLGLWRRLLGYEAMKYE
jgi:hypothetical protein